MSLKIRENLSSVENSLFVSRNVPASKNDLVYGSLPEKFKGNSGLQGISKYQSKPVLLALTDPKEGNSAHADAAKEVGKEAVKGAIKGAFTGGTNGAVKGFVTGTLKGVVKACGDCHLGGNKKGGDKTGKGKKP